MIKVKIGAQAVDMALMRRLAEGLEGRTNLIAVANPARDETVSPRCLPQLAEMGVHLVALWRSPRPPSNGPSIDVTLDKDKLRRYARK